MPTTSTTARTASSKESNILFATPPPKEECPICSLPYNRQSHAHAYYECCGQITCHGCANSWHTKSRDNCPFCRATVPKNVEEAMGRARERAEKYNDPEAILLLGYQYQFGRYGITRDYKKAVGYYRSASELGSAEAHFQLGKMYYHGNGVELDKKMAVDHWKIAAIMGHDLARHNLGVNEYCNGNVKCAMRHFMMSAKCGHNESLNEVKKGYMAGMVTKHDFEKVLRAHQASLYEMNSKQRFAAAKSLEALQV